MPHRVAVFLIGSLLSLGLMGCPTDPIPVCEPGQNQAIVFFDRSASARGTAQSNEDFRDAVQALVDESLVCQDDRASAYLLFANTGTAFYKHYVVQTPAVDLNKVDEIDRDRAQSRWERGMAEERRAAAGLFVTLEQEANVPSAATMHTDIHESLRLIHEAFEQSPTSTTKRVLYLSDMHESMSGEGRRDFDARPPSSREEARAWAETDAARLVEQEILPERALEDVEVRVVRSTLGINPKAGVVRDYWEHLFELLGATVRFG